MKTFRWDSEKNRQLKRERGIRFEQIAVAVEADGLLEVVAHPNQVRYPGQRIMIVQIDAYAYLVPFVVDEDHIFLKTIIPSRKATRDFIDREAPDNET